MALSEGKIFLKMLIAHVKKMFRLVVKSRELDAKDAKDLEAQAEVNFSLME